MQVWSGEEAWCYYRNANKRSRSVDQFMIYILTELFVKGLCMYTYMHIFMSYTLVGNRPSVSISGILKIDLIFCLKISV